jgi:multiple sugar transport system substrate-binding protein
MSHWLRISLGVGLVAASVLAWQAPTAAQTTIKFVETSTRPPRTAAIKEMIAAFEAANKDIKVDLVTLAWDTAYEKLLTMLQSGESLDVMEVADRWMGVLVARKDLVDLTPYVSKWAGYGQIQDSIKELGRIVDDKSYMIPVGTRVRAVFYNKALFKQAGIDKMPETQAEFAAAAKTITEKVPGKYGYCLRGGRGGFSSFYMHMNAHRNSADWFDPSGNSTFGQPEAVKGIQYVLDLYKYAPKDSISWGYADVVQAFYSGQCAMLEQDPDALVTIEKHMDESQFGLFKLPKGPAGKAYPTIGYAGLAIHSKSKNKDAAWKLIEHLLKPENNQKWAQIEGILPIHKGADQDPFFKRAGFKVFFEQLGDANFVKRPFPGYLPEFGNFEAQVSVKSYQEGMLGKKSADEISKEWVSYLSAAQKKWLGKN